jgi:hypothetical protein
LARKKRKISFLLQLKENCRALTVVIERFINSLVSSSAKKDRKDLVPALSNSKKYSRYQIMCRFKQILQLEHSI